MKNINWLLLVGLVLTVNAYSQFSEKNGNSTSEVKSLHIGYSKTTSIVFPYAIKSVDRGSQNILAQKANGTENILLLKAAEKGFAQTNLTIVTSDGRLYVFVVDYEDVCPDLNIKAENAVNRDILFSSDNENQKKIKEMASTVLTKKKKNIGLKRANHEMRLEVNGIFIQHDVLYLRVAVLNSSKINYDIDQFRFFIRDQRRSKRTASQEIEILPLYSTSSSSVVPDKSEVITVYALEKFTIPEKKYLTLQLIEKNGGRNLEVNIKNNALTDKVFHIETLCSGDF